MTTNNELKINKDIKVSKNSKFLLIKRENDSNVLITKILKKSLTAHEFKNKNKNLNQLWWAITGIIISILTWQLSSEAVISIYGSIILILISLFLYLDYIFQKEKIVLRIFFNGSFLDLVLNEEIEEIEEFFDKLY